MISGHQPDPSNCLNRDAARAAGASFFHCRDNNLDAPATVIADRAREHRAVDGKPLVILMGEEHTNPAHRMLQTLVLQKLHRHGRVAHGSEYGHNKLGEILDDAPLFMGLNPDEKARVSAADHDGALLLDAYLMLYTARFAPVSEHTKFLLCRSLHISTRFNDLALKRLGDFDLHDPLTRQVTGGRKLESDSGLAISLRNAAMVAASQAHMQHARPDFYVHDCGLAHVFGMAGQYSYVNSLAARFRAAGIATLCVVPGTDSFGLADLPDDSTGSMADTLFINGLDDAEYEMCDSVAEAAYVRTLAKNSGYQGQIGDTRACQGSSGRRLRRLRDAANSLLRTLSPVSY